MYDRYLNLPGGRVAILDQHSGFPPIERALLEPNGLIAIGGDLTAPRLIDAYQHGIFPWYEDEQPILWWSPDPRMVLYPTQLKVSRSLAKRLKKQDYEVRFNTAFRQVMTACAETQRDGQPGTWITQEMIEAYCELQRTGYALSCETWMNDVLVGGAYGIRIGNMFYGESMFHHVTDASKIAFVHLVRRLEAEGVGMIDCQMKTVHLASLGAIEIPRKVFLQQLAELIQCQSNQVSAHESSKP